MSEPIRVKPLYEKEGFEPTTRKFVPTPGRMSPWTPGYENGIREYRRGKNQDGSPNIVRTKKTRYTAASGRSVCCKATNKAQRFILSNEHKDARMGVLEALVRDDALHMSRECGGQCIPNSYRGKGNGKSRSRLLG